jgi:hypothetical protein
MSARSNHVVILGVLLFASTLAIVAVAQNPTQQRGTGAYERGLGDLLSLGRVTSLEVFLEDYPNSPLRKDALELLIWKYQQVISSTRLHGRRAVCYAPIRKMPPLSP